MLDVPGIEYQLHPSDTEEHRLTSLDVIIKDNTKKFSEIFRQLPYGIIKKNITGIGATTLALTAENNSIIVCPTRNLAYEKYCKGITEEGDKRYLYIGSAVGSVTKVKSEDILAYLKNKSIAYKKILVVADSLPRLMEYLPQNLEKWHIMVDEIDCYQTDGSYRPALERVIDYFFRFPEKNRCLVSATIRPFSDPRLANLPIIDVRYEQFVRRPISMLRTNNIHKAVASKLQYILQQHPDDKIVVAYNKVSSMRTIIDMLPESMRPKCEIWCSSQSEQQAGPYYPQEDIGTHLNKQITFLTCTHFTGIDIEDRFHLISVSDTRQLYTLLSPEKLLQIAGRCRHKEGLLSELFIYDIQSKLEWNKEFDKQHNIDCAAWMVECVNLLNRGVTDYQDVIQGNAVRMIVNQMSGSKVSFGGSTPISLVRYDIDDNLTISYLNIDALDEFVRLRSQLYINEESIIEAVSVDCEILEHKFSPYKYKDEQQTVEIAIDDEMQGIQTANIDECVQFMKARIARATLNEAVVTDIERCVSRAAKQFVSRFHSLMRYAPHEYLIDILSINRNMNNKWFKSFYNAVVFNALADDHPFRVLIENTFKPDIRYSSNQIYELMVGIFNSCGLKFIEKPATAVSYLQSFCSLGRRKDCRTRENYHRVVDYHSQKYLGKEFVEIPRIIDKYQLAGSVMKLK